LHGTSVPRQAAQAFSIYRIEMQRFAEILPEFAKQVENALRKDGSIELANQIPEAQLIRWTYETTEEAGFIYLESRALNIVERNVVKPFYSHSVELEDLPGMIVVDIDNCGRITGIEALYRPDIFDELAKKSPTAR
jgi:hypothetical protein